MQKTCTPMIFVAHRLRVKRDQIISLIYEVFDGVTREGTISWSQADLEYQGTEEKFIAAGLMDNESCWQELVGAQMFVGCSASWYFLEPGGFRYYLAPRMITGLLFGDDDCFEDILTCSEEFRESTLRKWSFLTAGQNHCIAQYIYFMAIRDRLCGTPGWPSDWEIAFHSHWHQFLKDSLRPLPEKVDDRVYFSLDD